MESNSTVESSSESGVLLIASLLTSLKRVPSFKRILRLFNSTSSSSKCSSRRDVSVKMKSTPVLLCNVLPNGDGTDSYDSNYNENATTNHHVKSVQKNLHKLTDDTSNIESLCKVTDVPSYLQFNPFILTGYRQPCMTSYDCLKSLLYFHNETINIMTHVISLIVFALVMPKFMPWQEIGHPILAYTCVLGSVSSWVGSSIYHLFMNHEKGEPLYHQLLQYDVIGIWITQTIGASTTLYISVVSYNYFIQVIFLLTYVIFSMKSLNDVIMATSAPARVLGFASLVVMRVIGFILRINSIPSGAASPLIHVIMQEGWALIGSIFSATRTPERFYPGRFDYIFNSHNIMHVFVVLGAFHMVAAASYDLVWLQKLSS